MTAKKQSSNKSAQALVNRLITDTVQHLTPYQSARRIFSAAQNGGDWLNANESPYNNSYSSTDSALNRYPDCQPPALLQAYADYADVEQDQVLVSRGADEGIELLIRAFCTPGQDNILICPPTYGMYAISAQTFNVGVKMAPLTQGFELDVEEIIRFKQDVKLVFICSPNNPTGDLAAADKLEQVLQEFAETALVVVDEAYIEFAMGSNQAQALERFPNLVVLRTLSKAFALAGIRCGFTLASPAIIQTLLKVIAPYPIPAPVADIALQALSPAGLKQCRQQVSQLKQQQNKLKTFLTNQHEFELLGQDNGNFLLLRCQHKQALMEWLLSQHILVRDQSSQLHLENGLRISIGDVEQTERLINALTQFISTEKPA